MRQVALLLLLGACAQAPAVEARLGAGVDALPPPRLQPLADILARADALTLEAGQGSGAAAGADSRVEALATRAAALRAPVLTAAERERLGQAR